MSTTFTKWAARPIITLTFLLLTKGHNLPIHQALPIHPELLLLLLFFNQPTISFTCHKEGLNDYWTSTQLQRLNDLDQDIISFSYFQLGATLVSTLPPHRLVAWPLYSWTLTNIPLFFFLRGKRGFFRFRDPRLAKLGMAKRGGGYRFFKNVNFLLLFFSFFHFLHFLRLLLRAIHWFSLPYLLIARTYVETDIWNVLWMWLNVCGLALPVRY